MKQKKLWCALSLLLSAAMLLNFGGCAVTTPPATSGGTNAQTEPGTSNTPNAPVVKMASVNLMADVKPSQTDNGPGAISTEASAAAADFALRLFRAGCDSEKNTLISPLSVLSALAMTANGADGITLTQMESTLGLRRELWNEFFRSYLAALAEDEKGVLHLANAIWFTNDSRFTVNRDFLQTNADYYGADAYSAPFDDTTLKEINDWVNNETNGMIPEILDEIPPEAVMYLVNALAFDAKWEHPYTEYSVQSGKFTTANGAARTVDFMHSEEHAYLEDAKATGFIKCYQGGRYAFAALLPNEGVSVEDYLASLSGEALQAMLAAPRYETVYTALPKFEAEWSAELNELLESMGMTAAFDGFQADFSGLGISTAGNIYISRVIHKTFISVAEDGTRAGAATLVEASDEAAVENPKQVYLDRPFVYMLIDCQTGIPFFIGTMLDPAE